MVAFLFPDTTFYNARTPPFIAPDCAGVSCATAPKASGWFPPSGVGCRISENISGWLRFSGSAGPAGRSS